MKHIEIVYGPRNEPTIDSVGGAGTKLFIVLMTRRKCTRSYSTTQYLVKEFQNICTYATRRLCDEKRKYKYFEMTRLNIL